jgi:hypothetical protein
MQHYRIRDAHTRKETGVYPQVDTAIVNGTINDENYLSNWMYRKIGRPVSIPQPILRRGAKLTQCLSTTFVGMESKLLITAPAQALRATMRCYGVQFLPTTLHSEKWGNQPAFFVHPHAFGYVFINTQRSVFAYYSTAIPPKPVHPVQFKDTKTLETAYQQNWEEALLSADGYQPLYISHLVLQEDIDTDFFALRSVPYGGLAFYVSERLREAMEKAGNTGIQFMGLNEQF